MCARAFVYVRVHVCVSMRGCSTCMFVQLHTCELVCSCALKPPRDLFNLWHMDRMRVYLLITRIFLLADKKEKTSKLI